MVGKDLVTTKLVELSARAERVRSKCPASAALLARDADALDERWAPAKSLAEGFSRLEEQGVLTATTAENLRRAVGLRNLVAHGYARVDPTLVYVAATSGLDDLSHFATEVSIWMRSRP